MDIYGFALFALGLILYFALNRKAIFLFISGCGAGLVVGAIWAVVIVNQVLR